MLDFAVKSMTFSLTRFSKMWYIYLFIYLFIYLSIYLLIDFNLYLFDGLVPKTRVKKFNIFRQEFRAIRQFRI